MLHAHFPDMPTTSITTDMLMSRYGQYRSAVWERSPEAARGVEGVVISGSGLNAVLERYVPVDVVETNSIPNFPAPSVAGHSSLLRLIDIEGKRVAHFTGRCHLYEGFSMIDALAQIGLGALLGARFVVLTNSAGGLHPLFRAGDVMLIADTLNLLFRSVKRDWMKRDWVPTAVMDECVISHHMELLPSSWRNAVRADLARKGIHYQEGTYIAVSGPTYETPAEARMYRYLGGHAIGMSTVHEVEFARACGMNVFACSLITNTLPEALPMRVSHEEVVRAAAIGATSIAEVIASACALFAAAETAL
jgi:purine-nucleoside phosphorylase